MRHLFIVFQLFVFSLLAGVVNAAATSSTDPSSARAGKYVINLISKKGKIDTASLQNLEVFDQYLLYITEIKYKDSQWNRLRLGFYPSRDEALSVLESVRKAYPRAWVTTVSDTERAASTQLAINLSSPIKPQNSLAVVPPELVKLESTPSPTPAKTKVKTPITATKVATPAVIAAVPVEQEVPTQPVPEEQTDETDAPVRKVDGKLSLIEQARNAMTAQDYSRVVQLTTYLLNTPEASNKKEALELLGLARERKKQFAHAKAEYEHYLSLYPDGEDATRVRQRLAGLLTAYQPVQVAQQDIINDKKAKKAAQWRHIGSLSQFYYRNQISDENETNLVSNSLLISTLDTTSRLRADEYNHRVQLTVDNQYSFIDGESRSRFSNLYYEIVDRTVRNSFRIGRQSYDSSGVFGRFDGVVGGLEMGKYVTVGAAAGSLIEGEDIFQLDQHKKFVSGNFNVGTIANKWDFNFYAISQLADNITDRKAIGTEIRYFEPNFNIFSLADYDIYFNELNTFILNSNWVFADTSTLFANVDIRKSPYISTSNALIGQTAQSINELLNTYTQDEIKQLAIDRTAQVNTYTFGGTLAFNSISREYGEYRLSMDATMTNTSSTPESGGVPASEATGNQYFLNTQLIGSNIYSRGDSNILFLRSGFSQDAEDYTLGINSRFRLYNVWRINPIVQYNNRSNKRNNSTRKLTRLVLRVENQFQSNILFETELGMDYESNIDSTGLVQKNELLFFHMGYRIDF